MWSCRTFCFCCLCSLLIVSSWWFGLWWSNMPKNMMLVSINRKMNDISQSICDKLIHLNFQPQYLGHLSFLESFELEVDKLWNWTLYPCHFRSAMLADRRSSTVRRSTTKSTAPKSKRKFVQVARPASMTTSMFLQLPSLLSLWEFVGMLIINVFNWDKFQFEAWKIPSLFPSGP